MQTSAEMRLVSLENKPAIPETAAVVEWGRQRIYTSLCDFPDGASYRLISVSHIFILFPEDETKTL